MRKGLWAGALMLVFAAGAAAQERPPRLVTMTGQGVVQGTPDRAFVTVGVEIRNPDTKVAQEQAAVAMQNIQDRLKSLGIPESALPTSSFNVTQDWEYVQNRRNLRGYVVSNQMEVRVDDIANVRQVIDQAIAAGANVIHGVRWDMKNRDALERQALRLAFEDARARAQVIADAAGAILRDVIEVQEARAGMPVPVRYRASLGSGGVGGGVGEGLTVINPGEMEIRAAVTVSFQIQG